MFVGLSEEPFSLNRHALCPKKEEHVLFLAAFTFSGPGMHNAGSRQVEALV